MATQPFEVVEPTVPEPATLILSTASTLILAGLSWKRRLARRND